jgi:hypothetical protein
MFVAGLVTELAVVIDDVAAFVVAFAATGAAITAAAVAEFMVRYLFHN